MWEWLHNLMLTPFRRLRSAEIFFLDCFQRKYSYYIRRQITVRKKQVQQIGSFPLICWQIWTGRYLSFQQMKTRPMDVDQLCQSWKCSQCPWRPTFPLTKLSLTPKTSQMSVYLFFSTALLGPQNGKLDRKYEQKNATVALLAGYLEFRDKLMQAWQARSFKEIRNLNFLSWVIEWCDWCRNSSTPHSSKVEAHREKVLAPYPSMQGKSSSAGFLATLIWLTPNRPLV